LRPGLVKQRFDEFAEALWARYPAIIRLWLSSWGGVGARGFDAEIRIAFCAASSCESMNARDQTGG
jgi:transposase-like protein